MQAKVDRLSGAILFGLLGLCVWVTPAHAQLPADKVPAPRTDKDQATTDKLIAAYMKGPHTAPVEQTLVGIDITNTAADGEKQVRHGNGFVLREDGFILAPVGLFSMAMSGRKDGAVKQSVAVIIHPGTEQAQFLPGHMPHYFAPHLGYTVFKLSNIHTPSLRTLLPDTLKPDDTVQVVWSAWDEANHRYQPLERKPAKLGAPPQNAKEAAKMAPGAIRFTEPLEGVPTGAVVIGPEGMAIGVIPGSDAAPRTEFIDFTVLEQVTNCITPVPTPDKMFEAATKAGAEGGELPPDPAPTGDKAPGAVPVPPANDTGAPTQLPNTPHEVPLTNAPDLATGGGNNTMVNIPGGPVLLPIKMLDYQPDLEGAGIVCVAPFKIDKYEVTNHEYQAFWNSLPTKDRDYIYGAYYPVSWAKTNPPFPDVVSNVPVLGVSLAGAEAYARWKGKRLPTPYEWSLVAFGPRGELQVPDWVNRYADDRKQTWLRIRQIHLQYMQAHPEIRWDQFEGWQLVPWLTDIIDYLPVTAWSKRVVEDETAHLWQTWHDPDYILPVGSRPFDTSIYGVRDVLLNGAERVMPYPGPPHNGGNLYFNIGWQGAMVDPPLGPDLYPGHFPIPPLSRLLKRSYLADNTAYIVVHSSLFETESMLPPLSTWSVQLLDNVSDTMLWEHPLGEYQTIVDNSHVINKRQRFVAVVSGENYARLLESPGAKLWASMPAHFRPEMGRPIPLNEIDRDPPMKDQATQRLTELYYLFPAGFRCAR